MQKRLSIEAFLAFQKEAAAPNTVYGSNLCPNRVPSRESMYEGVSAKRYQLHIFLFLEKIELKSHSFFLNTEEKSSMASF